MCSRYFTCACNVILLQFEPCRHRLQYFLYAIHASFLLFLYSLQLNQSLVEIGPSILWMGKVEKIIFSQAQLGSLVHCVNFYCGCYTQDTLEVYRKPQLIQNLYHLLNFCGFCLIGSWLYVLFTVFALFSAQQLFPFTWFSGWHVVPDKWHMKGSSVYNIKALSSPHLPVGTVNFVFSHLIECGLSPLD